MPNRWVSQAYLIVIRDEKNYEIDEIKEIIIDVPLAISRILSRCTWPIAAFGELISRELTVKDSKITVFPR